MHSVEIWIDVCFLEDGKVAAACTLFGRHEMPIRPLTGESISYLQYAARGVEPHWFTLHTNLGPDRTHLVRLDVEDISHYASSQESGHTFNTSVRLREITVVSLEDAKALCAFLCSQHNFEVDPYGLNRLNEIASEA